MTERDENKFIMHPVEKEGEHKGERLILINDFYKEGIESISLGDLIDFLKEHNIDPKRVPVKKFITFIKPAID